MGEWLASVGRTLRRVLVGLAVLVALAYGGGVWWFGSHCVPGATVAGIDVSLADDATLVSRVEEAVGTWRGTLSGAGGFELELAADDVGLAVDGGALVAAVRGEAAAWSWPLDLLQPPALGAEGWLAVDDDALGAIVREAVAAFDETATQPSDAALAFDEATGHWEVVADEPGEALEADGVAEVARAMALGLEEARELGPDCLLAASVGADDPALLGACEAANAVLAHRPTLRYADGDVAEPDAATVNGWIVFGEDGDVTLDADAISAWVSEVGADAVAHEDDLHVYVLDVEQATADVTAALTGEGETEVELVAEVDATKPELTPGARERGRHLDVNLKTQYARLYDASGAIVWESYIVSGDLATGHDTPTGEFHIISKQKARWLIGDDEDGDGEPDYRNYVDYWMLFREGGYGLHDASWRSYFGGDIYTYAGSHGCINLPPAKAATLYDLIRVGDLVYVHF